MPMDAAYSGSVVIHSLPQALAAASAAVERGRALNLLSVPAAAGAAGIGWFAGLGSLLGERFPALPVTLTLDCGDEPGLVLGALRRGLRSIVFAGTPEAAGRLAEIAAGYGAVILRDRPPALDLNEKTDLKSACADWFSVESNPPVG